MSQFCTDNPLPAVRRTGISVEDLGDEILLYDRESDTAHCLGAAAALVWRACDGELSLRNLVDRGSIDQATAERALDELEEQGLLETPALQVHPAGNGISRRQAVGRLAAAAAAPLVVSVAAPTAWATHSARAKGLCSGGQCPSGLTGCKHCNCPTGTCPSSVGKTDCDSGGTLCARDCCPSGFRCTTTNCVHV